MDIELIYVSEQSGVSPGMEEEHCIVRLQFSPLDMILQSCHCLTGVQPGQGRSLLSVP